MVTGGGTRIRRVETGGGINVHIRIRIRRRSEIEVGREVSRVRGTSIHHSGIFTGEKRLIHIAVVPVHLSIGIHPLHLLLHSADDHKHNQDETGGEGIRDVVKHTVLATTTAVADEGQTG